MVKVNMDDMRTDSFDRCVSAEARLFGMVISRIAGHSISEIAKEFSLSRRWVSTCLNRPAARATVLEIQEEIAQRLIAIRVSQIANRSFKKIGVTSLLGKICDDVNKNGRKRTKGPKQVCNRGR